MKINITILIILVLKFTCNAQNGSTSNLIKLPQGGFYIEQNAEKLVSQATLNFQQAISSGSLDEELIYPQFKVWEDSNLVFRRAEAVSSFCKIEDLNRTSHGGFIKINYKGQTAYCALSFDGNFVYLSPEYFQLLVLEKWWCLGLPFATKFSSCKFCEQTFSSQSFYHSTLDTVQTLYNPASTKCNYSPSGYHNALSLGPYEGCDCFSSSKQKLSGRPSFK
jgi:hypothetical protein